MNQYAKVMLVAVSMVAVTGQVEAKSFFKQALRDIGNGAKAVGTGVGVLVGAAAASQHRSPNQNPCGVTGGSACANAGR